VCCRFGVDVVEPTASSVRNVRVSGQEQSRHDARLGTPGRHRRAGPRRWRHHTTATPTATTIRMSVPYYDFCISPSPYLISRLPERHKPIQLATVKQQNSRTKNKKVKNKINFWLTDLHKNYSTDLHKIRCRGGTWAMEETVRFRR